MPRSNNPYIRSEMIKITDELKNNYNIEIKEIKEIDYGIQYNVKYLCNKQAMLNLFCNKKKKFKFASQKIDKDILEIIQKVFNQRDYFKNAIIDKNENNISKYSIQDKSLLNHQLIQSNDYATVKFESNKNKAYSKIKYLYNILKKYRNDNFDFIDLLESIREVTEDKNIDENLRYDFNGLENFIKNNLRGVLEDER